MTIRFAVLAAAVLLLAGCAGASLPSAVETTGPTRTATAAPTASPTAKPTPSGVPVGPSTQSEQELAQVDVSTLRITGKGFSLEGADGTVYSLYSFYSDAATVMTVLQEVLGVAPVRYQAPPDLGGYFAPPGIVWNFDGLLVIDQGTEGYAGWRYTLVATVPVVGGVSLVSPGDFTVGDAIADTEAVFGYPPYHQDASGTSTSYFEAPYSWNSVNVSLIAGGTSTTITLIVAPTGA